ncbi:MAG TPA: hypothetical protein PKY82_00880 [Pyrinomonadaceae bacterium]|nr:hypothetical protein [Pyrinomonadaceae bacterium]
MDDYFKQAIPQYEYRIRQALDSIPQDLSVEQTLLAAKCSERLNEAKDKLDKLQNGADRLREFQRIIRDIEYVETVGLAALERSNEVDEKLNFLVKKIRHEIKYPLKLPPAVTAISRDYFYVHTRFNFNLICVPPGERHSLLHLPDLYHELAHPLLTEKNLTEIQPFKDGLSKIRDLVLSHFTEEIIDRSRQRGPEIYKTQPEIWLQNWYQSWATEFLCDLFAVYTLGPAFAWSHYHLCAKKTENPFEVGNSNSSHPADHARMDLMLFALDKIGFSGSADKIEEKWKDFIKSSSMTKEIEYEQCYPRHFLGKVEDLAYEAVSKMNVRIATSDTDELVHSVLNRAWERFWENQDSYVEWEREEVERLYENCKDSSNTRAAKIKINDMKNEIIKPNPISLAETKEVFQKALLELLHNFKSPNEFIREYTFLSNDDIYKLQLVFEDPPRKGIYDHIVFERKFYLSEKLLQCFDAYWLNKKVNDEQKKRMCKLFFLHEFLHTPQHVDSNTYPYSKNSKDSFRRIDYDADAFAVKGCFKIEFQSSYLPWNEYLAEILIAHIKGGEVFALADDGRNTELIDGERLHRQAIWHLQYARARAFNAEGRFDEFYLDRHLEIEIFHIFPNGDRENLCLKDSVSINDFQNVIDINISWAGIRIRHSITAKHFLDSFIKGIFYCDFESISEAFRPLFDDKPELVGRSNNAIADNSFGNSTEEFDRIGFTQKLYSLHSDDLGQIIISIPQASQKVSGGETNARKIEQLISWAESGSGPGIEKIYEVAKKLFPKHFT